MRRDPVTLAYDDGIARCHVGDVREVLRELPTESAQCVVTSPPYWALRDYGTPGQLGLEATPEEYVASMVAVFREVRRVLRKDGTLWLNLGDSYAAQRSGTRMPAETLAGGIGGWTKDGGRVNRDRHDGYSPSRNASAIGLKHKDLVGIPWSVAKALQAPYYTGRIAAERDRAWLAALIDGEGTICGFHHVRLDDGRPRTGVNLFVTNSSDALLRECDRIWPTSRSEHMKAGAGHLGSLLVERWIVHGIENKMVLLRELYPHLIAKKQQAVVAYTLLELMADAKSLGHSPQRDAVREKRHLLTRLMSDLNHVREVVLPSWLVTPPSLFEEGWYLRSEIIWAKPNCMPESVTDRPTKAHEYLFLLTKSARYYYDAEAIKEAAVATGNRNKRSVWTIATQPYPEAHFATFPEALVEPCILAGSAPEQTVLDPFTGSGTTLAVAKRLNRNAVGIELNPAYLPLIAKRCKAEGAQIAMLA